MDDNVPDVCVICGYIISPEEDNGEFDLCLKCQRGGICGVERGLDPWHADAFVGTPAEGMFENREPRKAGWYALDWCGNVIGFTPDREAVTI